MRVRGAVGGGVKKRDSLRKRKGAENKNQRDQTFMSASPLTQSITHISNSGITPAAALPGRPISQHAGSCQRVLWPILMCFERDERDFGPSDCDSHSSVLERVTDAACRRDRACERHMHVSSCFDVPCRCHTLKSWSAHSRRPLLEGHMVRVRALIACAHALCWSTSLKATWSACMRPCPVLVCWTRLSPLARSHAGGARGDWTAGRAR